VKKAIKTCDELKERLKSIKKEKRKRIIFAVVFCVVAGVIMSEFLILGFSIWLGIAFFSVWSLLMIYGARETALNQDKEKLGCED
jgi:membrane protein implicated in regulation of membrane protease activity